MFSRTYYIDKEKTKTIKLSWEFFFKNLTITEGGRVVGKFQNIKEAKKGRTFILLNGDEFFVRLDWRWFQRNDIRRFEILLNGKHVKGSIGHPKESLIGLAFLIVMMVVLYIGSAFWVKVQGRTVSDLNLGLGIYSIALSVIFFILGYFVVFWYSKRALSIIAIILLLDIVFNLIAPKDFVINFRSLNFINLAYIDFWVYLFKSIYFVVLLFFIADFDKIKSLSKN